MSKIKFILAAWSDAAGRPVNEDSFLICKDLAKDQWLFETNKIIALGQSGALIVVCDGMGGMNAGEVASALAVQTVKEQFSSDRLTEEIISTPETARKFVADAIIAADSSIKEAAKADTATAGMGSTIVLAWLIGEQVHIGWCGDSRAYRFNPATGLERLSHDHSYVQELVDAGRLSPALARLHPDSNIITRSLGDSGRETLPDTASFPLCRGDVLLLCSDGLCGVIDDIDIEKSIRNHRKNMRACRDDLLKISKESGWTDNLTLALCRIAEGGEKVVLRKSLSETVKQGDKELNKKLRKTGKSSWKRIFRYFFLFFFKK
jgi:serine/threonine protein phosphatase PrpC